MLRSGRNHRYSFYFKDEDYETIKMILWDRGIIYDHLIGKDVELSDYDHIGHYDWGVDFISNERNMETLDELLNIMDIEHYLTIGGIFAH